MNQDQFETLLASVLALGHELQHVEVKSAGRFDGSLRAKTLRAMLGMANRRDGGFVIIGTHDKKTYMEATGIDSADAVTWDHDRIADQLALYADPSVRFERQEFEIDGKVFILLSVSEFEHVPVLCKQNLNIGTYQVLKRGACYVRPRRKHETSEIATFEDMRELIDLAAEKQLVRFEQLRFMAGATEKDNRALFKEELQVTPLPDLVTKIHERGFWKIVIRPEQYSPSLIADYSELAKSVHNASVQARGWQYPYVSGGQNAFTRKESDAYGEGIRWDARREYWQMFQSGQYVHWVAMWVDWLDSQERAIPRTVPQSWQPETLLPIVDTIALFDTILNFASRLALSILSSDTWTISITGTKLQGRMLWQPNQMQYLISPYLLNPDFPPTFDAKEHSWQGSFDRSELTARHRTIGGEAVLDFFKRAEWDPGIETITAIRGEIS